MTSRQARRERREAERKTKKSRDQRLKALKPDGGFVSQKSSEHLTGSRVELLAAQVSTVNYK